MKNNTDLLCDYSMVKFKKEIRNTVLSDSGSSYNFIVNILIEKEVLRELTNGSEFVQSNQIAHGGQLWYAKRAATRYRI